MGLCTSLASRNSINCEEVWYYDRAGQKKNFANAFYLVQGKHIHEFCHQKFIVAVIRAEIFAENYDIFLSFSVKTQDAV